MGLLIFTPTYADLMRPETEASINAQVTTVPWVWHVGRHNPYPTTGRDMRNVVAQYQQARQMVLDGEYDALLTVEHDMILPAHAVQTLWETDAPVVYGVYLLRHGTKTLNAWQYCGRRNLGMSLSLYPREVAAARRRGWVEVCGVGWGCTLIRRPVLEQIQIHSESGDAGDIAFATDCVRAGIKQIARFDVPCGHIEPDGTVLEPFAGAGGIVSRVYALVNVTARVEGQSLKMLAGRYYTMPVGDAQELVRAGYVTITNDTDTAAPAAVGERETAVPAAVAKRSKRKG